MKIHRLSKNTTAKKIIVIVGPTASGKSDLAVSIARRVDGEIISADSRQVYKGLDIAAGKITKSAMRGVPHHLLDVADPKRQFSVNRFRRLGNRAISDIVARGKVPIVCGGTALYIDALLGRVTIPAVPPNRGLRKMCEKLTAPVLYERLLTLDPVRAASIDKNNPRRLVRAIEIATALGKVPQQDSVRVNHNVLMIGIKPDSAILRERIRTRLMARMKRGMRSEVLKLHNKGLSWKRMEDLGLEYRYLKRHFADGLPLPEVLTHLESETHHYAKRQMTWWKRDKNIHWFTEGILSDDMKHIIDEFLCDPP